MIGKNEIKNRMIGYTDACLTSCAQLSEKTVTDLGTVLDSVMSESQRITKMSEGSLKALEQMRGEIKKIYDGQFNTSGVIKLSQLFRQLNSEHNEVEEVVMPIIQSLQFQDRIRQQMENLVKMLKVWHEQRSKVGMTLTDEERVSFGQKLMALTTTDEERVAIRAQIPTIPEEKTVESDFFF